MLEKDFAEYGAHGNSNISFDMAHLEAADRKSAESGFVPWQAHTRFLQLMTSLWTSV